MVEFFFQFREKVPTSVILNWRKAHFVFPKNERKV
jgi:hypothetical protein